VPPLRAFHHSTNIGSGIDPINELEVGEDLPRCEPFDFLLTQAVEPIKKRTLLGGQLRRLFWREAWGLGNALAAKCVPTLPARIYDARQIQTRRHERAR
jgi:hypothetical protein